MSTLLSYKAGANFSRGASNSLFGSTAGHPFWRVVFDVLLNGKTVLQDFDILSESGQPDSAVWKEFELEISKDLTVALTSKTGTGSLDRMPLISAVQVLRIE